MSVIKSLIEGKQDSAKEVLSNKLDEKMDKLTEYARKIIIKESFGKSENTETQ